MKRSLFNLLIVIGLFSLPAEAKRFRNAYLSFELPPNWNCTLEGSEWVCESAFSQRAKEAIIILTAKEVGPSDSLAAYKAHLQMPRTLPAVKGGSPQKSQVLHVKERMIANHMWIDGMHLGSEVGPYFTRYLATIKEKLAILITFSAHKEHYTKYSGDFRKAIESLTVVATKDILSDRSATNPSQRSGETIGAPIGQNIPSFDNSALPTERSGGGKDLYINLLILALLIAAVGGYFYFKQKPKGKK